MKFKISTLLWLLTLVAVVLFAYLWVQRERDAAKATVEANQTQMDQRQKELEAYVGNEIGKSFYFREQLGFIANDDVITQPYVKLIRLPRELGGMQLFGPPLVWQWRLVLPDPEQFELCWTVNQIPQLKTSFDVPQEHLHISHLNIKGGTSLSGNSHSQDSFELDAKRPVQVDLYFRIDAWEGGGRVHVNYEIYQPTTDKHPIRRSVIYRGEEVQLSAEESAWVKRCGTSRGGYSIAGFGIEHRGNHVPLLDQAFSLDQPIKLLRVRTTKPLGKMKYEPYQGASAHGLLIWIRKRTVEVGTDRPKVIQVQLPDLKFPDLKPSN